MDDEIIHVLMLNESATQKATKFQGPHCRRANSTGLRSWFVNYEVVQTISSQLSQALRGSAAAPAATSRDEVRTINWVVVRPGSASTASFSARRPVLFLMAMMPWCF